MAEVKQRGLRSWIRWLASVKPVAIALSLVAFDVATSKLCPTYSQQFSTYAPGLFQILGGGVFAVANINLTLKSLRLPSLWSRLRVYWARRPSATKHDLGPRATLPLLSCFISDGLQARSESRSEDLSERVRELEVHVDLLRGEISRWKAEHQVEHLRLKNDLEVRFKHAAREVERTVAEPFKDVSWQIAGTLLAVYGTALGMG